MPPLARRWMLSAAILAVAAPLSLEFALRAKGSYRTYSERNYGVYRQVLGSSHAGYLHDWGTPRSFEFKTAEFAIPYVIQQDGVRDRVHEIDARAGCTRIVVLGDSFAEGVGARVEDAWPARLEARLRARGLEVEVLNAGVSGSDPFYEYQLLAERFLAYRPQLVIVSLNQSDIGDVKDYGGFERFCDDGTTRARPAPWFADAYRRSHLVRFWVREFGHYDAELRSKSERVRLTWDSQQRILECLGRFAALGRERGFDLWTIVHPVPNEFEGRGTSYFKKFFALAAERGITVTDLTLPLIESLADRAPEDYAWPIDRHFKPLGYDAFAQCVEDAFLSTPWATQVGALSTPPTPSSSPR